MAFLSLIGSLVQLGAATFLLGHDAKEVDLLNKSRTLAKAVAYGDLTHRTMDAMLQANVERKELGQALKDANRYFGELNAAME